MTDLVRNLQPASWRGIAFPVVTREFGFSHEQARHRYIYRNEQIIDSIGRENPTWTYQIPFREGITVAPWSALFTEVYPGFLAACMDSSMGVLEDPIHGAAEAKCASLREMLAANRRDGVDVEATFVYSPDPDTLSLDLAANMALLAGMTDDAKRLDSELTQVDWEQEEPPPALSDPFAAIGGVADQIQGGFDRVNAKLDDVAWRADKTIRSIDRLKQPKLAPIRQRVRRLQDTARRARTVAAGDGRKVRHLTVAATVDVITLAARVRNTTDELIGLNGFLVGVVSVRKGTVVRYYSRGLTQANVAITAPRTER